MASLDRTRIGERAVPATMEWFDDRLMPISGPRFGRALGSQDFFLLEGPPGTGKTSFITELVRQELHRNPASRILLVSQTQQPWSDSRLAIIVNRLFCSAGVNSCSDVNQR